METFSSFFSVPNTFTNFYRGVKLIMMKKLWVYYEKFLVTLTLALVVVTFYQVVARYALVGLDFEPFVTLREWLNPIFLQELEWHLFALLFLLGASYGLRCDAHVRVDIFYQRYTDPQKRWVNLIGFFLFFLPFVLWVLWVSVPYAYQSFSILEGSPNPGGLGLLFLIKGSLGFGFFLLLLEAAFQVWRTAQVLRQGD